MKKKTIFYRGMLKRIIISRTDAIGDVILTLPLAGILKSNFPGCHVIFLGKSYTESVIKLSEFVDDYIAFGEKSTPAELALLLKSLHADCILHVFPKKEIALAAKKAGIPLRIGTSHRLFHLLTCNKLVNLGRKNAGLHEAQLNTRLLEDLGIKQQISLQEMTGYYGFSKIPILPGRLKEKIIPGKFNLILHPTSNASAREWPLESYMQLIRQLDFSRFRIFITGQNQDQQMYNDWLNTLPVEVVNLTGQMTLEELIAFIYACDGLVACSTGPLHIAAALDKFVVGLYPSIRPMHAGRWGALGKHALNLSFKESCTDCRNEPKQCSCMRNITVGVVVEKINGYYKEKNSLKNV